MITDFVVKLRENIFNELNARDNGKIMLINSPKVKQYKVENILTLSSESGETFDVKITDMLYFKNIKDVFSMINKQEFGYSKSKTETKVEDEFLIDYKIADVEKYGLVVINFVKI